MNKVAEEILMHYGVGVDDGAPGRGSGRYPKGSGDNPYQHAKDFRDRVAKMRAEGMSEPDIAKAVGLKTTSQLRVHLNMAREEEQIPLRARAKELRDQGLSLKAIAKEMGYNSDSSVRALLNESTTDRLKLARTTADYLKQIVDEKGMLDVGEGVPESLGISAEKMRDALYILEQQGYNTYGGRIPQPTNPEQSTTMMVLTPPGTQHKEIFNYENVHSVEEYDKILTENGQAIRKAFEYPASMDQSRLKIRYAEEGGKEKDGLIELRRGVEDLNLGDAHYAQVRVLVGGTHYLKGMAVYSDDLPDGVDVVFNTNKKVGTPPLGEDKNNTVLKKIKDDPTNPFGALIKERGGQMYYDDPNGEFTDPVTGKKQSLNLVNKRSDEGDWGEWAKDLPSQFLSKQPDKLLRTQLNLAMLDSDDELDTILSLTNPTVKKALLDSYADDAESAAVHLKAASFPGNKYEVLIPLPSAKESECYAPQFEDGEKLALVRFPHTGPHELPIVTVNNKLAEGKKVITPQAADAIGINSKVAERLSGADFDGDAVLAIPLRGNIKINSQPLLQGLVGFDPGQYQKEPGTFKPMTNTQMQMGIVSNLITDMYLKGANSDELAAATRHSMVVIDAEKHGYDWQQSEADNHIQALRKRYQAHQDENGKLTLGASTLVSAASSPTRVIKTRGSGHVNQKGKPWYDPDRPEGVMVYEEAFDARYTDRKGRPAIRTQGSSRMMDTDDAMSLVSDWRTHAELAYAEYANHMKSNARRARLEMVATPTLKYSPTANKTYAEEAKLLEAEVKLAKLNKPRERQALRIANSRLSVIRKGMETWGLTKKEMKEEMKKASQREVANARVEVGSKRHKIDLSKGRLWEAIQAGAIHDNLLKEVLLYADMDVVRKLAMPRNETGLSEVKQKRIKALAASGRTIAEIAKAMNISTSTVSEYI